VFVVATYKAATTLRLLLVGYANFPLYSGFLFTELSYIIVMNSCRGRDGEKKWNFTIYRAT